MALLCLNFGILFFDRNALNFLMPYVQPELGLSYTQVGLLGSALSLTWALAAIFVGWLSDKAGRRKVIIIACTVLFALCSVLSGLATSFLMLLGARLVLVPIALASGWRHAFFIAAVPGVISALLIWLLVIERKLPPPAPRQPGDRAPVMQVLSNRNVLVCSFIAVVLVAYLVVTWGFMPLVLVQLRGIADTAAAGLMAVLGVASALCSFIIPWLSDIYGRRPVMCLFTLVGVILPLGALWFDGPAVVLGMIFFVGWMFNGTFPTFMATVPHESVSPQQAATAMGVVMGVGEIIGGVLAPSLAGRLSDVYGLEAVCWLLVALAVVGGIAALFLRETAPRIVARQNAPATT